MPGVSASFRTLVILILLAAGGPSPAGAEPPGIFNPPSKSAGSADRVRVEAIAEPENVRRGEEFELKLVLSIQEGWHVYSMSLVSEDSEPLATQVRLADDGALVARSPWTETPPRVLFDGALQRVLQVHRGSAELTRRYSVAEEQVEGTLVLRGSLAYRACDNRVCTLPRETDFRVVLQIAR